MLHATSTSSNPCKFVRAIWQRRLRRLRRLSALSTNHVRKLILGDVRLHWRHFGHLMPPRLSLRSRLTWLLREASTAVSALLRQQHLNGAHLRRGNQSAMIDRKSVVEGKSVD